MTRVLLYALHVTYSPDYAFPLKAADASKWSVWPELWQTCSKATTLRTRFSSLFFFLRFRLGAMLPRRPTFVQSVSWGRKCFPSSCGRCFYQVHLWRLLQSVLRSFAAS